MQSALLLFGILLKGFVDAVAVIKQNKEHFVDAIDKIFSHFLGDPEDVYQQNLELVEGFAGKWFLVAIHVSDLGG